VLLAHQPILLNAQAASMVLPSTAIPSKTVCRMLIPVIQPVTASFAHSDMEFKSREVHRPVLNVMLVQAAADATQPQKLFAHHAHMELTYRTVFVNHALLDAPTA
jgi:hypothetical protein